MESLEKAVAAMKEPKEKKQRGRKPKQDANGRKRTIAEFPYTRSAEAKKDEFRKACENGLLTSTIHPEWGESQDAKADAGKPRLSLVPTQIIFDIAEIRDYGNKKYGSPENWKKVNMSRYVDALLRHTMAFVDDPESRDAEIGLEHYKHMACNMAFICHMMAGKK